MEKYFWTRQATDENMAHELQTHIQKMQYLLLCHGSGNKNSPQYYVVRILIFLLTLERKRYRFSIRPTPFYATPRDVCVTALLCIIYHVLIVGCRGNAS